MSMREIKSFVRRQGRMTAAQHRALQDLWARYGLQQGPLPLGFSTVFGREAETVLEIGFGMGEGLLHYAKAEPEKNFLGIEVHGPGVGALFNQLDKENVTNVRVFQADAMGVLAVMIPPESLARIQLFFPDPWPKKRHHKRRIVQADFIQLVLQKLKVGGRLHMATDWGPYAAHMLATCESFPLLNNLAGEKKFIDRPASRPLTRFEARGQRLGHEVWDLLFEKSGCSHAL